MLVPVPIDRRPRADLAVTICDRVARAAYSAIELRQRFVICIAGGSVAETCLPLLAHADLPWPMIHVLWADERAVPIESADSNAGRAMRLWADTPLAAGATAHPIRVESTDLERAADDYEREIFNLLGSRPVIDLTLLGVGDDGHIASLFPDRPALDRTDRLAVVERQSPKPPAGRISLSLPFLAGSREVIVAAFGDSKEQAVMTATTDAEAPTPLARLLRASESVTVMRDE